MDTKSRSIPRDPISKPYHERRIIKILTGPVAKRIKYYQSVWHGGQSNQPAKYTACNKINQDTLLAESVIHMQCLGYATESIAEWPGRRQADNRGMC